MQASSPTRCPHHGDDGVPHAGALSLLRLQTLAWPTPPQKPSVSGCRYGCPGPGSFGGGALSSAERQGGGSGALLILVGRTAGGASSGLARAGAKTPPSPVEIVPLPPRKPASRHGLLVYPSGRSLLSSSEPSFGRPPPLVPRDPERKFGRDLERSLPVSCASWLGRVENRSPPEKPASSLVDMLLLFVLRRLEEEGLGGGATETSKGALEVDTLSWVSALQVLAKLVCQKRARCEPWHLSASVRAMAVLTPTSRLNGG